MTYITLRKSLLLILIFTRQTTILHELTRNESRTKYTSSPGVKGLAEYIQCATEVTSNTQQLTTIFHLETPDLFFYYA